jgi:hypothetical protein
MHDFLDAAITRLPTEAGSLHPSDSPLPAAAWCAQVVVCEDLAVNGVLAKGSPLALSTWVGRTGLSEMPPPVGTGEWLAWTRRVRLDQAWLRPYARAVYDSTDAYIAALPDEAFNPTSGDKPGSLLSALLLTLSMRTGVIAYIQPFEARPTASATGVADLTILQ